MRPCSRRVALAGAASLFALSPAAAQTSAPQDVEARIRALETALESLKAELAQTRGGQAPMTTAPAGSGSVPTAPAPATTIATGTPASATPGSASAVQASAPPDGFRAGPLTIKYGGFVKLDASASDFSGGDPVTGDLVRDFLLPGSIPVGGVGENPEVDFNARQTRFFLATQGTIAGRAIGTRIEMDFQALPGAGDNRTISPSNPALRRAFVTVDKFLFGQEWSTFQNTTVLPETADLIGPTSGTVFQRSAQIRYASGPFSISVENPETTVTPFRGGTRIVADDSALPDLALRYDFKRPRMELSLAGLARRLSYTNGPIEGAALGYGVSASGKLLVGERDDLRFMLTGGEGIGRYVGLNFGNDVVIDGRGELEAIPLLAGFAAFRHYWAPTVRSTFILSAQEVDNERTLTGLTANKSSQSAHVNLIWSPGPGLDVGGELIAADRELESGASGELTRLILFGKYGF